jgi:outer membrane protein assembly factor BamB
MGANASVAADGQRQLDPATGQIISEVGLPSNVLGTPSVNAAGVIAASTFDLASGATNCTYLIDAATGTVLNTLDHGPVFQRPVFVGSYLVVATQRNGVQVYAP